MPQRNVATNFTFEQQRQEINLLAADFTTHESTVNTAAPTYLKHDGSNDFTGQTLAVPAAFTINSNGGAGTVTISGNLTVSGTTTTVNTATLDVTDKNITIAKGNNADSTADGAGITIDSATDITFNFVDDRDALVSSIGLEGSTFLKAPYGQFTGSGTATGGQGVEINAPDTNTGQIISYDRGSTAYRELRLKGSTVSLYTGTANALVGTFNNNGLSMESGKTITGVLATAAQPNITSLGTLTALTVGGRIQRGTATVQDGDAIAGGLNINGTDMDASLIMSVFGNDGDFTRISGSKSRNATVGSHTIVQDNDVLLSLKGFGSDGTDFEEAAQIEMQVDGTPGNNVMPGRIVFKTTTTDGVAERVRISSQGNVSIGSTANALRRLDVVGNSLLVRPNTVTTLDAAGNASAVNNSIIVRCTYGENAATVSNAGNRFGIQFTGANNTTDVTSLNWGDDPVKSASIYGVSEDTTAGYSRKVGMAFYTSNFDIAQAEKLRITGAGDVVIGHTAASAKLHVASGTNTVVGNDTNPAFQIGGTTNYRFGVWTTAEQGIIGNRNGDDGIAFHTKTGNSGSFGEAVRIASNGDVLPGSDNSQDLGSTTKRWANVYTGDMHLNNMNTGGNDVDGSEGHWTMQLSLIHI